MNNFLLARNFKSNNENFIRLQTDGGFSFIKVKEKKLITQNAIVFELGVFSVLNVDDVSLIGSINMIGDYTKRGRCYNVENGTFTFDWANAEDYGKQDTTLTGTWTLKRL